MAIFPPTTLAIVVFAVALVAFIFPKELAWSRKIPGPWIAKHTKLWYLLQVHKSNFHWTNIQMHRDKGSVVQVMPGHFSIDDPSELKTIYSHSKSWQKGEWYTVWNVGPNGSLTNLFSERNPGYHGAMRRKVAAMYSMSSLVSYEPYVDQCIHMLNEHLGRFAESGSIFNLAHWLQCYTFDVISVITFGERFGFLDEGNDIFDLMSMHHIISSRFSYLGLWAWMKPAFERITSIFRASGKELHHEAFTNNRIAVTKADTEEIEEGKPVYMVRKFLDAQRKEGKNSMTDWDVSANAGANIGAGSDTTAIALSGLLYNLYTHPRVLNKLREEIESHDFTSEPTFQTAQQMTYLQAVIKESLRIYPANGFPLWREVPPGGVTISGQFFPEGTNLGVNVWVAHRNRDVYGPDADDFRPERWIEAAEEEDGSRLTAMDQSFMAFGLGSRTCIGKNISMLEVNKLIPALVRDYDFVFYSGDGSEEKSKYLPATNKWFVKPTSLHARIARRQDR